MGFSRQQYCNVGIAIMALRAAHATAEDDCLRDVVLALQQCGEAFDRVPSFWVNVRHGMLTLPACRKRGCRLPHEKR